MRLTAFMPVSDVLAIACVEMPEIAGEPVTPPVRDGPAAIGALRLDLASDDTDSSAMDFMTTPWRP
ncbi:hypothetical protein [Streptomyces sp. NBC_00268]|nr:hypothetical protein [Streptomyces sp. NBC_00268]MCX5191708.1 hypothetical protein [Streptomyces sp. NBC_00268]